VSVQTLRVRGSPAGDVERLALPAGARLPDIFQVTEPERA